MKIQDQDRFIHVCQDNNLRLVKRNGELVLEQNMYANKSEDGVWLQYPETKWIPVPIIIE